MRSWQELISCAQPGVQAVYQYPKAVAGLCTYIVQNRPHPIALRKTVGLSAALCAVYTPSYTRPQPSYNRERSGVMPTVHSPNNKNYIDNLKEIYRKTVEKEKEANI